MVPNESTSHNNFGESRAVHQALMLTFVLQLIIPINFLALQSDVKVIERLTGLSQEGKSTLNSHAYVYSLSLIDYPNVLYYSDFWIFAKVVVISYFIKIYFV